MYICTYVQYIHFVNLVLEIITFLLDQSVALPDQTVTIVFYFLNSKVQTIIQINKLQNLAWLGIFIHWLEHKKKWYIQFLILKWKFWRFFLQLGKSRHIVWLSKSTPTPCHEIHGRYLIFCIIKCLNFAVDFMWNGRPPKNVTKDSTWRQNISNLCAQLFWIQIVSSIKKGKITDILGKID